MSDRRRAALYVLLAALVAVTFLIVTAEPGERVDTTPTTWFSGDGDAVEVRP